MAEVLITEERIRKKVRELGEEISADYRGKEIFMVVILKGSFIFAADLIRELEPSTYVDFLQVSSYQGRESSGDVKILKDLEQSIADKHVLIVEDIVDTGLTLTRIMEILKTRHPKSMEIVGLLDKPSRRVKKIEVKYKGFSIEDRFVVGYGLDENQKYRQLPHILELA